MIKDTTKKQEGGEKSTNLQAEEIVINQGLTYHDAKEIFIDLFRSNFIDLSEKAAAIAKERAEELVDDFISKIKERKPEAINSAEQPGMQYAIYTAQKEYAKTGDKDLSDMLVDVLVDRATEQERNLKQIVLNECLSVVPKLTISQLDTLTVIFIICYSRNTSIQSIPTFNEYLKTYISPFTEKLSKEASLYQHLEFTGCASISIGEFNIEKIFGKTYKGLFTKGFSREQFEQSGTKIEQYPSLVTKCLQTPENFQLSVIDDDVLDVKMEELKLSPEEKTKIKVFMNNYQMSEPEIKEFIKSQGGFMANLYDVWDNSFLRNISLTSVGIAIATANLRRKTGISLDLGIWIK